MQFEQVIGSCSSLPVLVLDVRRDEVGLELLEEGGTGREVGSGEAVELSEVVVVGELGLKISSFGCERCMLSVVGVEERSGKSGHSS